MALKAPKPKALWHLVDAEGQVLGRLATQIAQIVQGKHKPTYAPNVDCGDYVVVVNAEKVALTGDKWAKKLYRWHTGYPGGLKSFTAQNMHDRQPTRLMKEAVSRMLPKNRMRALYEKKLLVFPGPEHDVPNLSKEAKSIVEPQREKGGFKFEKFVTEELTIDDLTPEELEALKNA